MANKTQDKIVEIEIGIDEAGRGPVLGPLVYGCFWWPVDCGAEMKEKYGLKDSKKTTDDERRQIYQRLKEDCGDCFGCDVAVTTPEQLSNEMLSPDGHNLN